MTVFCSQKEFYSLITEVSNKAQYIRMQAKGGSMYPFIKSGDWIKLEPLSKCPSIKKGEVILFSKEGNLYAHRVVKKRGDFVLAKGDFSFGSEGNIPVKDVLARVVSVQRNGRDILLNFGLNRFLGIFIADFEFILQYLFLALRKIIGKAFVFLSFLQGIKDYRRLLKKIVFNDVVVRQAQPQDKEQLRDLYLVHMEDIEDGLIQNKKTGFFLVAQRKEKILGALAVSRFEKDESFWLINGLIVKPLYRGLGIGEKLVKEAIDRVKAPAARSIGLFVNKKSKAAVRLYKKLKFKIKVEHPAEFSLAKDELYLLYTF